MTTASNNPANSDSLTSSDSSVAFDSAAMANVYFLLARLWNHEVDAEALNQLVSGQVADTYVQAGGWLPEAAKVDDQLIESLAIEYCQCFLGPKGHLPPHQSVVAGSRFQGDCCDSIKKYADLTEHRELFEGHQQRMVDHAAVILSIMGKLHVDLQASVDIGDDEAFRVIESTRAEFFQQHVSWLIEYCQAANSRTQSVFFGGLFTVTRAFLTSEPS